MTTKANKNVGAPAKGLPIGNLASQNFADYYLEARDRFMREILEGSIYARRIPEKVSM
jgi:hypothetical protein